MTRRTFIAVTVLLVLTAACDNSVKHPLDDSETKPASAAAAVEEANAALDDVGLAVMADMVATNRRTLEEVLYRMRRRDSA